MKKQRKLKKGLAIVLTATMVAGLVPGGGTLQVSATESDENTVNTVSSNEVMIPEQTDGQATDKLITDWQWIDEEEILDEETGNLALPGANEQTPAYFDDVTAFLPTQIQATVVNADDSENPETGVEETISLGDWECDNYPVDGAYSGSYSFTAALPEGYTLSEEAKALTVLVELGGAQMWYAYGSWDNGLSWTLNDEGTLTFRGQGDILNGMWDWGESVKKIVISDGVTGIGNDAFLACKSLTTVSFADERVSTLSIGDFAFGTCTALESIVIPNYVTTLGIGAFNGCSSLQSVTFEAGSQLNAISNSTFYACYKLETINIPSSVESIGDSAFGYCTSLKTITIPDSVKTIDRAAFWGCSALESIMIPESVTTIGDDIFKECSNLKKVTCISGSSAETYLREKYPELLTVLYKVTIQSEPVEGYTITQADKTALPENGLLLIEGDGTDGDGSLSFRIEAASDYKKNFTVKADGTEVTAVDGVYTISGITENKTIALTIEGVGPCSHTNYNNGFCTECDAYEPAVLTNDKHDINGDEVKDSVYEISNAGQLYWFADKVNTENDTYGSANAVLTADITVNEGVLNPDGTLADGTSEFKIWTPIGNIQRYRPANKYIGIFDGQNHTVNGLYFNDTSTEKVGLFGYVGNVKDENGNVTSAGKVSNVGVVDSCFNGKMMVGGVCGMNYGTIENCYNKGTVSGTERGVGGVCGMNYGTIENCYSTGTVSGTGSGVGGVCGMNYFTIENCYNSGTVSGTGDYVGGVCGENYGTITNCYNTNTVSGKNAVGGVCGSNSSTITGCYNEGEVNGTGNTDVGGVCGTNSSGTIKNCYNTNTVSGTNNVGGMCGYSNGTIENCYNTGTVSGSGSCAGVCGANYNTGTIKNCYNSGTVSGTNNVGGVCGENYGTITNCYNTGAVSGSNYVGGVCGINRSTIKNCYYLEGTTDDSNATDKTEAQFNSGEVAYLLSKGCTIGEGESAVTYDGSVWGQDLSTADSYPVLDSTKKVYQNETYEGCEGNKGNATYVYANNAADPVYAAHTIGEDGICSICNQKIKNKVSLTSFVEGADADDTVAFLRGGGLYTIGTEATVIAQEKEGFTFKGWYNSEYGAEDKPRSEKLSYTFTPVEDTSLVAVYEANANITLNVNGERNDYYVNGELQMSSSYTRSFKAGSYVYVGYSGSGTFCYWKNASGNIVSRDREYEFMLVSDTSLTAVAVDDSAGSEESGYSSLIEFVSCYGQVIQATTWNSKDEASGKTLPAAPSKFGGTFKYWSLDRINEATVATILAAINGSTTRITVVPVYEEITTTYSITVKYPSDSNKDDVVYNNQKLGNTLTVTADSIEGKEFAYWSSDAEGSTKLSYSLSYFLLVSGDTTLYPIYSETVVEEQPVAAITNVSRNTVGGKNKLSFEVTRSVPAKYELVEQGVIYSVADTYATDKAAMVMGAGSVYKFVSSDTANNGVFIAYMNVTGHEDSKLYVKGYVIVKNTETGNTETIYTDMSAKSYNDLAQD